MAYLYIPLFEKGSNMPKKNEDVCFRTTIGGQALIEGIMMLGPDKEAVVVRTPEGIVEKVEDRVQAKEKHKILGVPFIRGVVNFMASMIKGMKALSYSASLAETEEESAEEPSKFDTFVEKNLGAEKAEKFFIGLAVFLGIAFSVVLFILLPTLLAGFAIPTGGSMIWRNLLEGLLRIVIFFLYLALMSRMKEIKRVFAYHGAEHKTIFCYEKGMELTVEHVRAQTRFHPRCGTSFLFVVMILSILVFSVVQWSNIWVRMGMRLVLLPVVVAVSYEINRWVGRHDNAFTRVLTAPGLFLQRFTTNEPDDSMIEVGIQALRAALPKEEGADAW
ncbi:MAG: DUF1385 domain-containing protein [Oscillospiraceae bacterium]